MPKSQARSSYKEAFLDRTRRARAFSGLSQADLGKLLGDIPQNKYEKYESRSLLPHHLIENFCLATHTRMEWLIAGRGEMAAGIPIRSVKKAAVS